jgi:DNA-binding NarL/FixJ family response regulator
VLATGGRLLSLLVVDDSAAFRRRLKRYLDDDPAFNIVGEAGSGLTALPEIERLRPDAVLLDLYIPPPDGFDVLRTVKRLFQDTLVVVLTSDASAVVRKRCEVLLADAVIDKADAAALLIPTLRRIDARRRRRNPA